MIRLRTRPSIAEFACRSIAQHLDARIAMAVVRDGELDDVVVTWQTPTARVEFPEPDRVLAHARAIGNRVSWQGTDAYSDLWSGPERTMVVPLVAAGETIGGIVVGLDGPIDVPVASSVALIGSAAGPCLERARLELELERSLEARSEFTRAVSHEFRTPLTAIVGYTDLILENQNDEAETVEFVQAIRRNGAHLLEMVTDLLDVARSDVGRLVVRDDQPIDIAGLLEDAVEIVHPQAEARSVTVEAACPSSVVARGDVLRTRQIIVNLLANSIKFTPGGRVDVSAVAAPEKVIVTVTDDGEGMTVEELAGLFLPFTGRSVRDPRSGSGLGLVISRRLAEGMGGSLDLSSRGPGKGTTATLILPVWKAQEHTVD